MNDFDVLRIGDLSKDGGELRVTLVEKVATSCCRIFKRPTELTRLLCDPVGSRMLCAACEVDSVCTQFNEEEHLDGFQPERFVGEKSQTNR